MYLLFQAIHELIWFSRILFFEGMLPHESIALQTELCMVTDSDVMELKCICAVHGRVPVGLLVTRRGIHVLLKYHKSKTNMYKSITAS